MFFTKAYKERLERIEEALKNENRKALLVLGLGGRVKDLEAQNKQLFDRLMARDFQELSVFGSQGSDETVPDRELTEDEDEENAGELLEITDET